MRETLGILGLIGIMLLVVWAVLWLAFGGGGIIHLLFPIGILLLVVQLVRRVAPARAR